jgi:hypothetical protein
MIGRFRFVFSKEITDDAPNRVRCRCQIPHDRPTHSQHVSLTLTRDT